MVASENRVATGIASATVVAVGGAVELDGLPDDSLPGSGPGVDLQVRLGEGRVRRAEEAEQARELPVRAHRDQVASRVDPVLEHRDLGAAQGHLAEDGDVVFGEDRGVHRLEVEGGEGVEALRAQDLGVVAA